MQDWRNCCDTRLLDATIQDYELSGPMFCHSTFVIRNASRPCGMKEKCQKNSRGVLIVSATEGVCVRSLYLSLRFFFPIPELAGFAAGNFNLHCHSTRKLSWNRLLVSEMRSNFTIGFYRKSFLTSSDPIYFYTPWCGILSRWQMKSCSTWHHKISKRCNLLKQRQPRGSVNPSCFVLYCGNICSLRYKTIIVATITLHAFILKRTACFDDCPLFLAISKDERQDDISLFCGRTRLKLPRAN